MRAAVLLLALSLNPVVGFTQGPVLVSYTSILPSRFHPFRKNDPLVPLSGELVNASAVLKYPRIRQALYHWPYVAHLSQLQRPGGAATASTRLTSSTIKPHPSVARTLAPRRGVLNAKAQESSTQTQQTLLLPDEEFLRRWDRAKAAQLLPSSGLKGWRAKLLSNATALLIVEGNRDYSARVFFGRVMHV
jgi:hypothetical protein